MSIHATKQWGDIQAETGFASYIHYLSTFLQEQPYFRRLLKSPDTSHLSNYVQPNEMCAVIDLSVQEDSAMNISLRHANVSPKILLADLRQPLRNASVQIVV